LRKFKNSVFLTVEPSLEVLCDYTLQEVPASSIKTFSPIGALLSLTICIKPISLLSRCASSIDMRTYKAHHSFGGLGRCCPSVSQLARGFTAVTGMIYLAALSRVRLPVAQLPRQE
ncbi:RIKEN cDNA 3110031B13, isoform CRA_a, partial [Mus musculus]